MQLEFWYDVACPYTYLASTQVERLSERTDAELLWRPLSLGGVFEAIGTPDRPALAEARQVMDEVDLKRWADWYGVLLRAPAQPRRTVLAMRALVAAGEARPAATKAIFKACWLDDVDVDDPSALTGVLDQAGLDGPALIREAGGQSVEDELRRLTEEAVGKGIFGVPSFVVGDQLFFGQDRLRFVARALAGWRVERPRE